MKHLITLGLSILAYLSYGASNKTLHLPNQSANIIIDNNTFNDSIRTIDFWFKPDAEINSTTITEHNSLIIRNTPDQANEWGFYIHTSTGKLNFFNREHTTLFEIESNDDTWNNSTFYHVVGVIDRVSGMKLYIDDVQQADTSSNTTAIVHSPYPTTIGKWGDLSIRYFNGQIDNLRMWSKPLASNEISSLSCDLISNQNDSLSLSLNMESLDTLTKTINDISGLGNNATYNSIHLGSEVICVPSRKTSIESDVILVYPNPSSTTFNVHTGGHYTFYELRNSSGKLIQMSHIVPGTTNLEIKIKTPGTYALIMHNGITLAVERLVKL